MPTDDADHIMRTADLRHYTASQAATRPAYVGYLLARHQQDQGWDDVALAASLGIETVDLPRLALCLRPRSDHWAEDIQQIARYLGADEAALRRMFETISEEA
jgi:hypothetical protein